jgi:CRP-like cAMP-binding protein
MSGLSIRTEDLLRDVELFHGLSQRHLKGLAGVSRVVEHPAGHVIAQEGLGSLALHVIVEGEAVVSRDGRELGRLGSGDYFGEISLLDGRPRSASVTAVTPMTVLALPQRAFQALVEDDPEFLRQLLVALCGRLRAAEARLDKADA